MKVIAFTLGIGFVIAGCIVQGVAAPDRTAATCYAKSEFASVDGCSSALRGRIKDQSLFTTMRMSGQDRYYSAPGTQSDHPVPFSAAGVDYGVGNVDSDIAAQGGYKTPGVSELPAGATLDSVNHVITLRFTGSDITLQGWDFTGWTVALIGSSGGTLHWWNNQWKESDFTNRQTSLRGTGILRTSVDSCTNIDVRNSEFVRDVVKYPNAAWEFYIFQNGSGACKPKTSIYYSYFESVTQHAVRIQSSGPTDVRWNLFKGMGQCGDNNAGLTNPALCAHGNFYVQFATQPEVEVQNLQFNTMYTDDHSMSATSQISFFIYGKPEFVIHFKKLIASHNILVSNTNPHHSKVSGTVAFLTQTMAQGNGSGVIDELEYEGNYTDCTGSYPIGIRLGVVPKVLKESGNVNLLTGETYRPNAFLPARGNGCKKF